MALCFFISCNIYKCVDSGEPAVVVVKCLELLGLAFGTAMTSSGFKLLPKYIRLIQVARMYCCRSVDVVYVLCGCYDAMVAMTVCHQELHVWCVLHAL